MEKSTPPPSSPLVAGKSELASLGTSLGFSVGGILGLFSKAGSEGALVTTILGEHYNIDTNSSQQLEHHLKSLFRFCYRKGIVPLEPYSFTSDAGWGCMIRCAQMLLCNTFRVQFWGSDWRIGRDLSLLQSNPEYFDLLFWFLDYPGYPHIYSLHHIVGGGMIYGKLPGEWYGGHTIALILADLTKLHRRKYRGPLETVVAEGHVLCIEDCEAACSANNLSEEEMLGVPGMVPSGAQDAKSRDSLGDLDDTYDPLFNPPPNIPCQPSWKCSLLVLLPLRLGVQKLNFEYHDELMSVFSDRSCVGILGGTPNHAIYFIGCSQAGASKSLIGFDPHSVEPAFDVSSPFPNQRMFQSVHKGEPTTIDLAQLDPSMCIGYFFKSREEFLQWCDAKRCSPPSSAQLFTISTYTQKFPSDTNHDAGSSNDDDIDHADDDDYVIV